MGAILAVDVDGAGAVGIRVTGQPLERRRLQHRLAILAEERLGLGQRGAVGAHRIDAR